MLNFKAGFALLFASLVAAPQASAATYTFDFTTANSGWVQSTSVQSNEAPGVSVLASGGTYSAADHSISTAGVRVATWQNGGLGVCSSYGGGHGGRCRDESHLVDGLNSNDIATFAFDQLMTLTSITFGSFEDFTVAATYERVRTTCKRYSHDGECKTWNYEMRLVTPAQTFADNFDFFSSGGSGLAYNFTSQVQSQYDMTSAFTSNLFGIGASGVYDAFKIKSITVQNVTATVPLPAGGVLLLSALTVIAMMRRRGMVVPQAV